MPHIIVEYSVNLEPTVKAAGLLQRVHQTALASSLFEPAAVRTRASPRHDYVVGEDTSQNAGFVLITLRLRHGRSAESLDLLVEKVLATTLDAFKESGHSDPVLFNVEVHELPPHREGARLN